MNVLGIETSCDETAAAVVADGRRVLSNVVFSQVEQHAPFGGVVPEIASRSHIERLPGVIREALDIAGCEWSGVDAVAVTYGPGLASSLLVGLSMAKGLAFGRGLSLALVNHLQAHVYSPQLDDDAPLLETLCPCVALVVSGGHSCLIRVDTASPWRLLGQTIDDAAGEAFDKGAKLLGLGYPGGPVMDRLGKLGNPKYIAFPRGRGSKEPGTIDGMDSRLCFSFSGLKTSLLYYLRDNPVADDDETHRNDVIASYQEAIVDALIDRTRLAVDGYRTLLVGGGVSLNSRLRSKLKGLAGELGIQLFMSPPAYCGDNAAMIAGLAGSGMIQWPGNPMTQDAVPSLPVADI